MNKLLAKKYMNDGNITEEQFKVMYMFTSIRKNPWYIQFHCQNTVQWSKLPNYIPKCNIFPAYIVPQESIVYILI